MGFIVSPISDSRTVHIVTSEGRNKLIEDQVIYKNKPVKVQVIREIVGDKLIQVSFYKYFKLFF